MASIKPLNPMATPYQKNHSSIPTPTTHQELCIYKTPQLAPPPPCYIYNHHQIMQQPPLIYTVNILHLTLPAPLKLSLQPFLPPPPLLSPVKKPKNNKIANIPIPAGPRIPKFRLPGRSRKVIKAAVSQDLVWRPKGTTEKKPKSGFGNEKKQRWKNRTGDYSQMLPMEDNTTSVMIKNIPNKYTRELMIQTLDNHCKNENSKIGNVQEFINDENDSVAAYDFLYLPIDFKNRVNAGFAFVNFTNPKAALRFRDAFHGKHWEYFGSPKIAEISRARIQGKEGLLKNCKVMNFTFGSEEDKPVMFEPARDGSDRVIPKMRTLGICRSLRALKM